ncbi:MAG: 3-deoxy-manno-octulosonate cytidylyltransferase [Pseudomonadota bacterium]
MRVVVIIPSRYGSTRFPGKPLAQIRGTAMLQRVVEQCGLAGSVTDVCVATDDDRIRLAVESFGGKCVMTDTSLRSGTDRVHAAARALSLVGSDIVVNVQGDQPLIHPDCMDEVTEPLLADPELARRAMSTLVFKIKDPREITDPKDVKTVFDENGFALYFSRATIPFVRDPGTPVDYYKHLGVYAYSVDFLERFAALPQGRLEDMEKLEQLRALEHGLAIRVKITQHDSPEVDLPEDIARIEVQV